MTNSTRRRFTASSYRITSDFYRLMTDLGATSLKINQDIMKNEVEVIFDRGDVGDNLRAIYHTIRFLYKALTEFGVVKDETQFDQVFSQVFGGFIAMPDDSALLLPSGDKPWWEILGVEKTANKKAVIGAYRALAKVHHPDAGGDPEMFKRLRRAYEQAIQVVK